MTIERANSDDAGGKQKPATRVQSGTTLTLTPPAKIDLRDSEAVRRELAQVYRDARAGKIATQDATRLGFLLDLIRRAFETCELRERLELLELTLARRRKKT
jgi:hypothetical protein